MLWTFFESAFWIAISQLPKTLVPKTSWTEISGIDISGSGSAVAVFDPASK
jgi:hypothetical protein